MFLPEAAAAPTPTIPLPVRQRVVVAGTVYDAALGIEAPLAGAVVTYSEYGYDYGRGDERQRGTVLSGAGGRYQFEIDLLPDRANGGGWRGHGRFATA